MNTKPILQSLSEIVDNVDGWMREQLIAVYNSIAAASISPCQIVNSETGKICGERAVKALCFKTVNYQAAWTLYLNVCPSHLETATFPERCNLSLSRFVIGDKIRCEQMPYSAALDGDNQKENG